MNPLMAAVAYGLRNPNAGVALLSQKNYLRRKRSLKLSLFFIRSLNSSQLKCAQTCIRLGIPEVCYRTWYEPLLGNKI